MNRSRVIFDVKPMPRSKKSGGGRKSELARYIAESERDAAREGVGARPLFSAREDHLSYWQAEQLITRGNGISDKEDIRHAVLSLRPRDYELLGSTDAERRTHLREIAAKIADLISRERGISYLRWYAGLHLNRPHPHLHFGFGVNVIDARTGKPTRLEHIPAKLLTRNRQSERGERETRLGEVAQMVARELDRRHRERIRFIGFEVSREASERASFARELVNVKTLHERAPTPEERLVGCWLMAEIEAARFRQGRDSEAPIEGKQDHNRDELNELKPSQREELEALRREVARLDRQQRSRGNQQIPAYLEPAELHAVLHTETSGVVVNAFSEAPAQYVKEVAKRHDEQVLGQSMVTRGRIEKLRGELEFLTNHGDKRLWTVYDAAHDRRRRLSEFNVHRRADARARREATEQDFADGGARHQFRQERLQKHLGADGRTLTEQRRQRDRALAKLTKELERAEREYALLQPLVSEIKARYKLAGEQLPVPYATTQEIAELLDQAIIARDAKRIRVLESIRSHNVRVHGEPARGVDEIGRLSVQRQEAEMDLAAHERRLAEFERTRHLSRWEIGDKTGWSLARIASERRMVEQGFNRAGVFALLPSVRKNTESEMERLAAIETEVRRSVDARRAELTAERDRIKEATEAIREIHEREPHDLRSDREVSLRGGSAPPRATARELTRMEAHAYTLHDAALLKEVDELARVSGEQVTPAHQDSLERLAARAVARQIIAEIDLKDERARHNEMLEWRRYTPVIVEGQNGQEVVATLAQTELQTLAQMIVVPLIETARERDFRARVAQAAVEAYAHARRELNAVANYFAATWEITESYRALLAKEGKELPSPEFTPKELNRIDLYIAGHRDPQERRLYLDMLDAAERRERSRDEAGFTRPHSSRARGGFERAEVTEHRTLAIEVDVLMEQEMVERDRADHEMLEHGFENDHTEQTFDVESMRQQSAPDTASQRDTPHLDAPSKDTPTSPSRDREMDFSR